MYRYCSRAYLCDAVSFDGRLLCKSIACCAYFCDAVTLREAPHVNIFSYFVPEFYLRMDECGERQIGQIAR
jgi:hypothetical protein